MFKKLVGVFENSLSSLNEFRENKAAGLLPPGLRKIYTQMAYDFEGEIRSKYHYKGRASFALIYPGPYCICYYSWSGDNLFLTYEFSYIESNLVTLSHILQGKGITSALGVVSITDGVPYMADKITPPSKP